MFVMGETFPLSYVRITCTGQGAVVSTDPSSLDFGRVKVLEEKKMDFELINDSPIPTQFAREVFLFTRRRGSIIPLRSDAVIRIRRQYLFTFGSFEISLREQISRLSTYNFIRIIYRNIWFFLISN